MKKIIQITVLILIGFFAAITSSKAQLYEISLDEKIRESSLIVEGEIMKSESFYGSDGKIYTASELKVSSCLKGEHGRETLSIITKGGTVEGRISMWSNHLQLSKGQQGIFFLIGTDRPNHDGFPSEKFEVYASMQGFIAYVEENGRWWGKEPFGILANPVQEILAASQELGFLQFDGSNSSNSKFAQLQGEKCLIYHIYPVNDFQQDFEFEADIYIESPSAELPLYQSSIILEYDTTVFGSNIASNSTLEVTLGAISSNPYYNLSVVDLTNNKVEVKITATTTNDAVLYSVTQSESWLARFSLTIQDFSSYPTIDFKEDEMVTNSKYVEEGSGDVKNFDCVDVFYGSVPQIAGFSPDIVAAGVDAQSSNMNPLPGIIKIWGNDFGNPPAPNMIPPPDSRVMFYNMGDDPDAWMHPLEGDYISWTDDTIVVRVPSIGYRGSSNNFSLQSYAGSGKIRVETPGGNATSNDTLFVVFCANNGRTFANEVPPNKSIKGRIENANGQGGHSLYFTQKFMNHASYPGSKDAFIRALNTWRCETLVNYIIEDSASIGNINRACPITFGTLPAGLGAGTEVIFDEFCQSAGTSELKSFYLTKFTIIFHENAQWYTGEGTPSGSQVDFETAALHEIGHGHLLRHVRDEFEAMFPNTVGVKRGLWIGDFLGGVHIVNISMSDAGLCPGTIPPMIPLVDDTTCFINNTRHYFKDYFSVKIFPNPVEKLLHLEFDELIGDDLQVSLHSVTGKVLQTDVISKGNGAATFELGDVPKGMYFLTLKNTHELIYSTKILKL